MKVRSGVTKVTLGYDNKYRDMFREVIKMSNGFMNDNVELLP